MSKTRFVVIFTVIVILGTVLPFFDLSTVERAEGATVTVPFDYPSIQQAINMVNPGDTITIDPGVYAERLTVDKPLTIRGSGWESTLITGTGSQSAIYITADDVHVSDISVTGGGMSYGEAGIRFQQCNQGSVVGCNITGNYDGISYYNSTKNVVRGNRVFANIGSNIFLYGECNDNVIENNNCSTAEEGGSGLFMSTVCRYNRIANNTFYYNYYGIRIAQACDQNTIENNTIKDTTYYGFTSDNCENNNIFHNFFISNNYHARDTGTNIWDMGFPVGGNYWDNHTSPDFDQDGFVDSPIGILNGNNVDNHPFAVVYNWPGPVHNVNKDIYYQKIQAGINFADPGDTLVLDPVHFKERVVVSKTINIVGAGMDKTLLDGEAGGVVMLVQTHDTVITDLTVTNSGGTRNTAGLFLDSVTGCHIENVMSNDNGEGIILYGSSGNTLKNNLVFGNQVHGIHLQNGASSNIIDGNNCSNQVTENGIQVEGDCVGNDLANNTCQNNLYGISLSGGGANGGSNQVIWNTLTSNQYGVVCHSNDNTIFFNRFNSNNGSSIQAFDNGVGNAWDNGTLGNFWSDYENRYVPPATSNGVYWDHPYELSGISNSADTRPLASDLESVPPSVTDLTTGGPTTGDDFTLTAKATDSSGVTSVTVEYWFGKDVSTTIPLTKGAGDVWSGIIPVPSNSIEPLHYILTAMDGFLNFQVTEPSSLTVLDNDGPLFGDDTSPPEAFTGDWFRASTNLSDNIGLSGVVVEYWFGTGPHTELNMTKGSGIEWFCLIPVADTLDDLNYRFHANDASGNQADGPTHTVTVLDDDLPTFQMDLSPSTAGTGDSYELLVELSDNIGMDRVVAEVWFGKGNHANLSLSHQDVDAWNGTLTVPHSLEKLHYIIHFTDTSNNQNSTPRRDVTIQDNDAPMAVAGDPVSVMVGDSVILNGSSSSDNIGVDNHTWTLTNGNMSHTRYGEILSVTLKSPGNWSVMLKVRDGAMNNGSDSTWIMVSPLPDHDQDGIPDVDDPDDDNDNWTDEIENATGTDPFDNLSIPEDFDNDTIPDLLDEDDDNDRWDDINDTFPHDPLEWLDSDEDGTGDNADPDDDGDQLNDTWEIEFFGNLNLTGIDDPDGDGHDNLEEFREGTDPTDDQDPSNDTGNDDIEENPDDSDGDGWTDADEEFFGTDPSDPGSYPGSSPDSSVDSQHLPNGGKLTVMVVGKDGWKPTIDVGNYDGEGLDDPEDNLTWLDLVFYIESDVEVEDVVIQVELTDDIVKEVGEENLELIKLYYLDEGNGEWVLVKDSRVIELNGTYFIKAKLDHLTVFAPMIELDSEELDNDLTDDSSETGDNDDTGSGSGDRDDMGGENTMMIIIAVLAVIIMVGLAIFARYKKISEIEKEAKPWTELETGDLAGEGEVDGEMTGLEDDDEEDEDVMETERGELDGVDEDVMETEEEVVDGVDEDVMETEEEDDDGEDEDDVKGNDRIDDYQGDDEGEVNKVDGEGVDRKVADDDGDHKEVGNTDGEEDDDMMMDL